MGRQLFSNNGSSILAVSLSPGDGTATVDAGAGTLFPSIGIGTDDYFYCTIEDTFGVYEIVKCTARTGDNFTIERAQEGTIANTFPTGSRFELRTTAATLDNFIQRDGDVIDGGTYT